MGINKFRYFIAFAIIITHVVGIILAIFAGYYTLGEVKEGFELALYLSPILLYYVGVVTKRINQEMHNFDPGPAVNTASIIYFSLAIIIYSGALVTVLILGILAVIEADYLRAAVGSVETFFGIYIGSTVEAIFGALPPRDVPEDVKPKPQANPEVPP